MKDNLLALVGAVVGGAIGFFLFGWLLSQGLYGLILPGGLLGIGASFAKNRSIFVAIGCGVLALGLGICAEWHYRWDLTLGEFLSRFFTLSSVTLLMIFVGGVVGFWCPFRQLQRSAKYSSTTSSKGSSSP